MSIAINLAFMAIADPTRREILHMLRTEEMTAGEIAERFDMEQAEHVSAYKRLEKKGNFET